jgi:hypothetical protein
MFAKSVGGQRQLTANPKHHHALKSFFAGEHIQDSRGDQNAAYCTRWND